MSVVIFMHLCTGSSGTDYIPTWRFACYDNNKKKIYNVHIVKL